MSLLKKLSLPFLAILLIAMPLHVSADSSAAEIEREVDAGLLSLFETNIDAKVLAKEAKGVLVFPDVVKAGLIVGAQYGEGALRINGKTVGYYNTVSASYGLQAGVQNFGYALLLMTDEALNYVTNNDGWEIGAGPSIVVLDVGAAKALTTTTARDGVYAVFFDQKGLMAGLGLQGTKISQITRD